MKLIAPTSAQMKAAAAQWLTMEGTLKQRPEYFVVKNALRAQVAVTPSVVVVPKSGADSGTDSGAYKAGSA